MHVVAMPRPISVGFPMSGGVPKQLGINDGALSEWDDMYYKRI